MITTRRKEPFRYSLEEPTECWIEIVSINDVPVASKMAPMRLIDISKSGCKVRTELDLRAENNCIKAILHTKLNEEMYRIPGEIRWQRQLEYPFHYYGLLLNMSDEDKEKFTVELRSLAASGKIKVM